MKALKRIREQAKMSQDQLATAVGVDRTTVTKWETGRGFPRGATLLKITSVLMCTVDDLIVEEKGNDNEREEN